MNIFIYIFFDNKICSSAGLVLQMLVIMTRL